MGRTRRGGLGGQGRVGRVRTGRDGRERAWAWPGRTDGRAGSGRVGRARARPSPGAVHEGMENRAYDPPRRARGHHGGGPRGGWRIAPTTPPRRAHGRIRAPAPRHGATGSGGTDGSCGAKRAHDSDATGTRRWAGMPDGPHEVHAGRGQTEVGAGTCGGDGRKLRISWRFWRAEIRPNS